MGDLTQKKASSSTKLVGSNTSGDETNFAEVTVNQDLKTLDLNNKSYISIVKTVSNTSEVLASVNASNLTDRRELVIENIGNKDIFLGPTGVASSGSNRGRLLAVGSEAVLNYGDAINVFMITGGGSTDVLIQEVK